MKYYINLIRNKNYKAVIISIVFFLLGCACVFFNLKNIIEVGIQNNEMIYIGTHGSPAITALSGSNFGMVIIGLIVAYTGLIFAPRNYPGSQNDEDYEVKSVDDCIYIKYKNREFLAKKETFSPTNLFFRDKNGKFVSMTTGYQIYNYVMYKHKDKAEKEILGGVIIGTEDIITKFSNIRLMNEEEKRWYIEYKKLKYKRKIISCILSAFFYFSMMFWFLGVICILCLRETDSLLSAFILGVISYYLGKLCNKISKRQMTLIDKIKKGSCYIADCYSYDKKISTHSEGTDFLIKVTDNNGHYLNEWFKINSKLYKNSEIINAKLIVIGEDAKTIELIAQ